MTSQIFFHFQAPPLAKSWLRVMLLPPISY